MRYFHVEEAGDGLPLMLFANKQRAAMTMVVSRLTHLHFVLKRLMMDYKD